MKKINHIDFSIYLLWLDPNALLITSPKRLYQLSDGSEVFKIVYLLCRKLFK